MWVQGSRKRALKRAARHIHEHSNFPQLYIYSDSDAIIPSHAVEEVIQVRLLPPS